MITHYTVQPFFSSSGLELRSENLTSRHSCRLGWAAIGAKTEDSLSSRLLFRSFCLLWVAKGLWKGSAERSLPDVDWIPHGGGSSTVQLVFRVVMSFRIKIEIKQKMKFSVITKQNFCKGSKIYCFAKPKIGNKLLSFNLKFSISENLLVLTCFWKPCQSKLEIFKIFLRILHTIEETFISSFLREKSGIIWLLYSTYKKKMTSLNLVR